MKMFKSVLVLWLLSLSLVMSHFNVSSLNINGAREASKRSLLYELMKLKEIDVMFVQETHSDTRNEWDWRREWGGEVVLSHRSSTSGGVALLFSQGFAPASFEVEQVVEGRLMVVKAIFERF